MDHLSRAADLLGALSSPRRLQLLATIDRLGGADPVPLDRLAEETGEPIRSLLKELTRLDDAGAVELRGSAVTARLDALAAVADRVVADHPVGRLLADEPELARFFRNGRLLVLPENPQLRSRVAALIARLLPDDTEVSEAAVNETLRGLRHDHVELRRLLVDELLVTRDSRTGTYRRQLPIG